MTLVMVATSALTAFLFHLPFFSCLPSCMRCVVGVVCGCACLCVSLRHVSGVEQLYQARRMEESRTCCSRPVLKLENGKDPVVTLVNLSSK